MGPLLTAEVLEQMRGALRARRERVECSLDLKRSLTTVEVSDLDWIWNAAHFPYPDVCKQRTIYHWGGTRFEPVSRYASSLIKLVPTDWGPPTFEIDGIKMLPTSRVSPFADAERKVGLIEPRGKTILDTCGGLGYFAAWCLQGMATRVFSYEKNPDVLWLRSLNPWSPAEDERLALTHGDIVAAIVDLPSRSFDAALHDPPRFGIAGELYSQDFYTELARVLKPRGKLFHYTGTPNRLTSGRDLPREVGRRLREAGFAVEPSGDGLLAVKR
ncbi:MAG: MnmC family methyltransferase [Steroidobacteraceae bacterium]|jgi:predicted methyltransferase